MSARFMTTQETSRVEVLKPQGFSDKRDAKELDNFLWHMERYFEDITLTELRKGSIKDWLCGSANISQRVGESP